MEKPCSIRQDFLALEEGVDEYNVLNFSFNGSDERQFNAPGFRISMPTIMRTPPSKFPEYHSSMDNLRNITSEHLADTLQFILKCLYIVDNNKTYQNNYFTEPFLTAHGIFKQVRIGEYGVFSKKGSKIDPGYLNQVIIHETDGKQDLISIAKKHGCSFEEVKSCSEVFEKAGLIARINEDFTLTQLERFRDDVSINKV